MENDDDRIDRFLGNRMDEAERQDFDQQLKSNPSLRSKTRLRRELTEFIGSDGDKVLDAINRAGDAHFGSSSKGGQVISPWLIALLLFVLTVLARGYYFWNRQPAEMPPPRELKKTTQPEDTPPIVRRKEPAKAVEPTGESGSPEPAPQEVPPTIPAQTPAEQIQAQPPAEKVTPPVSYIPIAALDAMVEDRFRGEISLEIRQPAADASLSHAAAETVSIAGSINQDLELFYVLYNNEEERFFNDEAVSRGKLPLTAAGDAFIFSAGLTDALPPALYYLLVMEKETEELLAVTRFKVVRK